MQVVTRTPAIQRGAHHRLDVSVRFDTKSLSAAQRADIVKHKDELVRKLMQTHRHALKNQIGGNLSGRQYSTMNADPSTGRAGI